MSAAGSIVIIGAGHAGVQVAGALRKEGVETSITLISPERHLPYERPPLSKRFLQGGVEPGDILLRDSSFYADHSIDLLLEEQVVFVDRRTRRVVLSSSGTVPYSHLVLATGSKTRTLSDDAAGVEGILSLRSLDDALRLRSCLHESSTIAVVGAGFIGMEFAAVAASQGRGVEVIELAGRPLGRSVSETTAGFLVSAYSRAGVNFHFCERVHGFEQSAGRVRGVRLADGKFIAADLVLVGVGALANDDLARESGLPCPNGVEVDEALRTPDPDVSAIGDCALHPNSFAGRVLRLESVQNAGDQARVVAARISGKSALYRSVPWFWSDLGDARLQIAGLSVDCDRYVTRGSLEDGKFSLYGFRRGVLTTVESVNRPADHLLAKRLLEARAPVDPDRVADESVDLKQLLTLPGGQNVKRDSGNVQI